MEKSARGGRQTRKGYDLPSSLSEELCRSFSEALTEAISASTSKDADTFRLRYMEASWLSKFSDPSPQGAADRRNAAIKKWQACDLRNKRSNERLQEWLIEDDSFPLKGGKKLTLPRLVARVRRTVETVIGATPPDDVLYGTFSSGASTGFRRQPDAIAAKFADGADVTAPCKALVERLLGSCDTWDYMRTPLVRVVPGGVLMTVPKNSKIDRVAIKEPELNMFCQKGVGDFIRHRLKRIVKVDLNDQTRNQQLARIGSETGLLATLDLSSASDLISQGLVRLLVPEAWYDLLDAIRSQVVVVDGEECQVAMFSSMGNGFTFELESLIFYAISKSVAYLTGARGTVSVYGDDIIVPTGCAGLLAKVLAYFGGKVNPSKSYWSGPFRESCGRHWWKGIDVTPKYLKGPIKDLPGLIHFLNQIKCWASRSSAFPGRLDPRFEAVWLLGRKKVPSILYGGRDLSSKESLVTLHNPRKRLVVSKKEIRPSQKGAYLNWLRAAEGRQEESILTFESLVTSVIKVEIPSRLILRPNVVYSGIVVPVFAQEWASAGSSDT